MSTSFSFVKKSSYLSRISAGTLQSYVSRVKHEASSLLNRQIQLSLFWVQFIDYSNCCFIPKNSPSFLYQTNGAESRSSFSLYPSFYFH